MNLNIANESIDFQFNSTLKGNTEIELAKLNTISTITAKDVSDSNLSDIILKTTGINTDIEYVAVNPWSASAVIPRVDKSNPIIPATAAQVINNADFYELVKGGNKILTGTIDRRKGKVGGAFSLVPSKIILGKYIISGTKLTTAEKTAIVLHEIGHLYTYYEYISETVKTNRLLSAVASNSYKNAPYKEKIIMLHEVDKEAGIKLPDKDKLAKGNDEVTSLIIIRETLDKKRSEINAEFYDQRSFEYLADQFVARHGAAVPLATALSKVERNIGSINTLSTATYLFIEVLKIIYILSGTLGSVFYLTFSLILYGATEQRYDDPITRTTRIKEQLLAQVQNKNLTDEQRQSLMDDIALLDQLIPTLKNRKTVIELIWEKIIPLGRRNASVVSIQREMEKLAFNELYQKAATLRSMK